MRHRFRGMYTSACAIPVWSRWECIPRGMIRREFSGPALNPAVVLLEAFRRRASVVGRVHSIGSVMC